VAAIPVFQWNMTTAEPFAHSSDYFPDVQEHIMPILLWLLGVPLSVVILLLLVGIV
jgi:hypothetical protein